MLSGILLVFNLIIFSRRTMGIMGSLLDASISSLRASQSSAFSAWAFSIVNLWLTLPTTKKQNLSLNLVDTDNERDTMFLPIFAP